MCRSIDLPGRLVLRPLSPFPLSSILDAICSLATFAYLDLSCLVSYYIALLQVLLLVTSIAYQPYPERLVPFSHCSLSYIPSSFVLSLFWYSADMS